MQFNEYQQKAKVTAIYPKDIGLYYVALGLSSECGEVAGVIKKIMRDNLGNVSNEKREKIFGELSDVLWYMAMLCEELGFNLDDIAEYNIKKLYSRKERGVLGGDGDDR